MANPWFRMYSEFSHDPKVQMLSEVLQRRYVMLLCLKCSNALETLHVTEIAFHLRISVTELEETKIAFMERGFIDDDWNLINWEKRQYPSDNSKERVSKFREKKRAKRNGDVTLQKRRGNVVEQNRTDTEEINTSASTAVAVPAAKVIGTLPLNDGSEYPLTNLAADEWQKLYLAVDVRQELRNMKGWLLGHPENRKTKKGIIRFVTGWLSTAQNKARPHGGTNGSNQGNAASERRVISRSSIRGAVERRIGVAAGDDDGSGAGSLPEPDDSRGNSGRVAEGVGGTGSGAGGGSVLRRTLEGLSQEQVSPWTC